MNKQVIGAICLIAIFFSKGFSQEISQDTIFLLNGTAFTAKVIDTTNNTIRYQYLGRKEKQLESSIEKERVFSINYSNGENAIIYSPDTTSDDQFSVDDMRYFIKGQKDALENFNSKKSFYGGIGFGLVGSYIVTPFIILSPVVPGIYSAVNGSRWLKIKKVKGATAEDLTKDTYLMGYSKVTRNKRIQSSLKGSAIGLVVGVTTMYILYKEKIKVGLFD